MFERCCGSHVPWPKKLQTYLPGGLPGTLRGVIPALKSADVSPLVPPRGQPNEFVRRSGTLPNLIWGAPGAHLGPTWLPEPPRKAPGPHFAPPGSSPGTNFHLFSVILDLLFRRFFRARDRFRTRLSPTFTIQKTNIADLDP